ncbi:type VII secretion protein EccE [Amycolatopsis taiwanensis]|uniref:Type VII secretion protein EccE n=1 Tax=Amycolatopsis taiwanensis TaxID=342230 RepID=A0A9W6VFF6_9PSEU|nr:type VII secretion protein EccE [Amycolatopsis taiwanensis]GLY64809.1 type VII secretion protein EccE [Amycolatopsis taiwanensis]
MTTTPQSSPARAAARSGAHGGKPVEPDRRTQGAAWFSAVRARGRLGVVSVARLLAVELVLVVAMVAVQKMWASIVAGILGVAVLVVLFGRSGGRWWTENLLLWLGFRARRGTAGEQRDDPRLMALCELAPDLVVEDIDGTGETRMGMGSDDAGWFAVIAVSAPGDAPAPAVPTAALARIAAEAEQTGVVMQVVTQSTPGTEVRTRERSLWVAVRLDARAVAESMIGKGSEQVDVPGVLSEITRRVERVLRRRGLPARLLAADEIVDALARSCDLVPGTGRPGTVPAVREKWDAWHSARLAHGCFWIKSWPDADRSAGLLAALSEVPADLVSIAFLLEPSYEGTTLRCLIRVAADPQRYQEICDRVRELARRSGARVSRLDGQHGPAVYASAPSGGGAR